MKKVINKAKFIGRGTKFIRKVLLLKPYILFLPFLILYIWIIVIKNHELKGDEGRYWDYAHKLLQQEYAGNEYGEYSYLWNGPGYPIILMPFRYFDTPLIYPRLLNAFFVYFGLIFMFYALRRFISQTKALLITAGMGLYYPFLYSSLPAIMTEAISFFCICGFIYFVFTYHKNRTTKSLLFSSFFLGYLALTKVIFGYVIVTMIVIFLIWYLFSKTKKKIIGMGSILILSLMFCSPYLIYTYNITGKLFYWSNSGGMNLYWMSTPYEKEYGDWHFFEDLSEKQPEIYKNHKEYLQSINHLSPVDKDIELKRKAIENISTNKKKFVRNWISNVSRIFLEHPYSYRVQSNNYLYYLIPNGVLIVSLIITIILSILNYRMFSIDIIFLTLFVIIYLAGVSLLSALVRFLFPVIPLLLLWISYTFENFIKIGKGSNNDLSLRIVSEFKIPSPP